MKDIQRMLDGTPLSGHPHRVEFLLLMLALPYSYIEAPIRSPEFRRISTNQSSRSNSLIDGGLILCDSNAIIIYLGEQYAPGSGWLPEEPVAAA
jgi:glutathione S-transferase